MEEQNVFCPEEIGLGDSITTKGFNKIFKNFSYLTLGKIGGDFFHFVFFVALSRAFGQEGVGQYSFAFAFTGFFSILADFGLYDYTIKEISRSKKFFENNFQGIISLRLILTSLLVLILFLIIPFLHFDSSSKIIIGLIGFYQIIYVLIDGLAAVFVANEEMLAAGLTAAVTRITTAVAAIMLILWNGNLTLVLLSFPVISVVQLIILALIINKKYGRLKITYAFKNIVDTLKQVTPYGTSDFLSTIYMRIDVVLIGFILGEAASGIYNVGYRLIFFLLFIPNFAAVSIFPFISRLFHTSPAEFRKMYNRSLSMMIIIGLPISAGIWIIAPQFIPKLFGEQFGDSVIVLQILAGLLLSKCLSGMMAFFLMSEDKQNEVAKSQFYATVFSFISNLILIYFFGIKGAAVATLLSALLLVVLYSIKLKDLLSFAEIKTKILISLAGTCAFSIPLSFFPSLSLYILIPVSVIIYVFTIIIFKETREDELEMFLSLVKSSDNNT